MAINSDIFNLGMDRCIQDAWRATIDGDPGPDDPTDFHELRARLLAAEVRLPTLYRSTVHGPYVETLQRLGEDKFIQVLLSDPRREGLAGLWMDIAHAILQNGERYEDKATDGFQEVVADLYDGFLSAEDRRGVKPPDKGVVPPLVKWGQPGYGPYTFTVEATANFGVEAGIVSLPPAHARGGLVGWAALAHETAGHDILHADTGLPNEMSGIVFDALEKQGSPMTDYWAARIDETASDVLGILNMGYAAGVGLISYFRAIRLATESQAKLSNVGHPDDPHPADILRGYLAAETVRCLEFKEASAWADIIEAETDQDFVKLQIGDPRVDQVSNAENKKIAKQSAKGVADAITRSRLLSLENHRIADIQNWDDEDEDIVRALVRILLSTESLARHVEAGIYAAHVVAAAVTAALTHDVDVDLISSRMLTLLKQMHDANPSWGPMFISSRGDLARHVAWRRKSTGTPPVPVFAVGIAPPATQFALGRVRRRPRTGPPVPVFAAKKEATKSRKTASRRKRAAGP
jgi:hypothetical protein